MIPLFPKFKQLELTDRMVIEAVVRCSPPDSDINFANLYAWNAQVSMLHGNIVVQLADYLSKVPFLTFIGSHNLVGTARELINLAKAKCYFAALRLIPENVAHVLVSSNFGVTEDGATNDYVYSIQQVASMHECAERSVRKRIIKFCSQHPNYTVRHKPLRAIAADEFRALFARWGERKGYEPQLASHEYQAFERHLQLTDLNIETIGIYVDACLVGFSTFELTSGNTAMIHFSKTDNGFHSGIGNVLCWEEARLLQAVGITHSNWGPDLGLMGLRQYKMKYRPCHFLKKYIVREN